MTPAVTSSVSATPAIALKRILYGTDFSPVSDIAGTYAAALALRFGASISLANVISAFEIEPVDPYYEQKWRTNREHLLEQQHRLVAAGISTQIAQSSERPVGFGLNLLARETGADLVAVGTESKSAVDRFLIGSTAEYLIRNAACPVLTIGPRVPPAPSGPLSLNSLVFATDLTFNSARAFDYTVTIAEQFGARATVCHVESDQGPDARLEHQRRLDELKTRLYESKTGSTLISCSQVNDAGPAEGILRLTERLHPDLVIMGARQRSFWLAHVRRGVTQDVLGRASCPVLTVR